MKSGDQKDKLYRTQAISKYLTRCKTSSAFSENPEHPTISKASRLVTLDEPSPQGQLSKFDLISWKLKEYHPSDSQKRLKFQNDVSLHKVINENPRPRSKPVRTQPSHYLQVPLQTNYKQHYELIRGGLTTSKLGLDEEEELNLPHDEISAQTMFKQTHQQLCGYITNHFKKYSQDKSAHSSTLKSSYTHKNLDQSLRVFLPKQIRLAEVAKVRDSRINERMENLLKKWRGSRKSINERFHQIWVKPIERQKGFLIKARPKHSPALPNFTVPVTVNELESSSQLSEDQ